ncbi:hypothetical protein FIU87_03890 [Bacillus sp. THAF10]|uniref:DUF2357 domain-containing protein n=1 Tax=Bacillus sp. THAF10 TaxID=2587848 RepID=UPI001268133B|nr:DUF2357 domain-containing protein [Bacillus sp. THAF10]QFT87786.1 hypothetical protein FIU87_03890 [Bacillus sp. THAF10]
MDTPCNVHPFRVLFTHIFQNGTKEELEVTSFVEHLSEWDDSMHSPIEIRENVNLELSFSSEDSAAKCYMDGFDELKGGGLTIDHENEDTYLACNSKVTLYRHSPSENYYPYIPGLYSLRVETGEGKSYFSLVKVISNRLFEAQLDKMRKEVEELLKGAALHVIQKQHSPKSLEALRINPSLFRQYQVLHHYFADIYALVADLQKKVRSAVAKEYILQSAEKLAHVDVVSIQHKLKRPDTIHQVKSVHKRIDYDLPENQVLKNILEKWMRLLHEFVESMDVTINGLTVSKEYSFSISLPLDRKRRLVEELKEYRGKAMRMNGALTMVKSSRWYQEVSFKKSLAIPQAMFVDARYRKLYQIDQALGADELPVHTGLSQQWKRTDQLYEIWGWLQVVEVMREAVVRGSAPAWMDSRTSLPPVAKDNMLQYVYEDIRAHITYDGTIPSSMDAVEKWTVPVFTTATNNNPDVRIDLFRADVFIGTIMIDMKYRKKQSLTDSMRQLTSYADNVRSPFIYGGLRWQKLRPVHQVLVLYPEKHGDMAIEELEDRSISFVPLTPAEDQTVFRQTLVRLVREMLEEAR